MNISPQPGPQTLFFETPADIAIYGGAAGSGKSFALLLEPLRHLYNKEFGAVGLRRDTKQIRNEGALWDESEKLYTLVKGSPSKASLTWRFPSGMKVSFSHLEYEHTVFKWQGSQIALLMFDELTHFTFRQFFYMLSRNRSASGVRPYVRATCNPDPDSWVRTFIDWWIGEDGFPIAERSGKIRWYIRNNDSFIWANSREELIRVYGDGPEVLPKSVTFIAASVYDNKILLENDPSYLANLNSLSRVERLQLLYGNWDVKETAGTVFQRSWFPIIEAVPSDWTTVIRFWDRAATKPSESNRDPDWTRGLLLYRYSDGSYVVGDLKSMRDTPGQVERFIRTVASQDSYAVGIMSQQDPGSAGVQEAEHFVRMLAGYNVRTVSFSKDKLTRAKPVSAQAEVGNIKVVRGVWNKDFFDELENFPDGAHDDIVDTLSGSFNAICGNYSMFDVSHLLK